MICFMMPDLESITSDSKTIQPHIMIRIEKYHFFRKLCILHKARMLYGILWSVFKTIAKVNTHTLSHQIMNHCV